MIPFIFPKPHFIFFFRQSTHDLNIDRYGAIRIENAGKHGDTLFRESIRQVFKMCATV
jgi:hypothetical protein